MSDPAVDPVVRDLRGEISEIDRAIVAAVNVRLELVARLKRYKESQGLPFLDLAGANAGPLSDEGLRDLVAALLELTKREVARDGDSG
jgi:Chorismate mutase type II